MTELPQRAIDFESRRMMAGQKELLANAIVANMHPSTWTSLPLSKQILTRDNVVIFTTPVDLSGRLSNLSQLLAELVG
jgi:hypothetical protein